MKIEAVIFDLGGVFLDIDYQKTSMAFNRLGVVNFDEYYQQSFANPLFSQLEKGQMAERAFFDALRKSCGLPLQNQHISVAWNAMLGNYRPSSMAFLRNLKKKLPVFLLSNTNAIHYEAIIGTYTKQFGTNDFHSHFHQTYFSHLIQQKKPDATAYELILRENNLMASTTLFVDDTPKNIDGAKAVGLQTLLLLPNTLVEVAMEKGGFEW